MTTVFDHHTETEANHPAPAAPVRARSRRARLVLLNAVVGLVGAAGLVGAPPKAQADVLTKLPENADKIEKRYAPVYDYDKDGCYVTAAIGRDGKVNPGLRLGGAVNGHCRDARQLDNANTYARAKCNNGWCAIMYANYHEKDQASNGVGEIAGGTNGHRHDWEHVVVWVTADKVEFVSRSVHKGWKVDSRSKVRFEGEHPKLVYHKEGGFTHYYRLANESDDAIENVTGHWFRPSIVGWNGYPSDFRKRLMDADFGSASIKINDKNFNNALNDAMPKVIPFNPFGAH